MYQPLKDLDEEDDYFLATKARVIIYLSVIGFIINTLVIIFRIALSKGDFYNIATLVLIDLVIIAQLTHMIKTRNINLSINITNLTFLIIIPLRAYQTGGIIAPVIGIYSVHSILMFFLKGKNFGFKVFIWNCLSIIGITFFQNSINPVTTPAYFCFLALVSYFIINLPIFFMISEIEALVHKLKKLRATQEKSFELNSVTHEISNILNIIFGYLTIANIKKEPQIIDKVQGKVKEIEKIISKVKSSE